MKLFYIWLVSFLFLCSAFAAFVCLDKGWIFLGLCNAGNMLFCGYTMNVILQEPQQ